MQNNECVPLWPEAEIASCSWLLDIELKIKFVWVPKEFILICNWYQYSLPNVSTYDYKDSPGDLRSQYQWYLLVDWSSTS